MGREYKRQELEFHEEKSDRINDGIRVPLTALRSEDRCHVSLSYELRLIAASLLV
jgi:hypothetical protein